MAIDTRDSSTASYWRNEFEEPKLLLTIEEDNAAALERKGVEKLNLSKITERELLN